MKKLLAIAGPSLCCLLLPVQEAKAQIPIAEIIKAAVTKVIKAVDLEVQRLQNKTIWLQNAQKTLENEMSQLKLDEITAWAEKQRSLYDDYFKELWKVKGAVGYYQRVRDIISRQEQMVHGYKEAWTLFKQDKNFTAEELKNMYGTYRGMLNEGLKNMDQLLLVSTAFTTQMSDAQRLEVIGAVSEKTEYQFKDFKQFTEQNKMVSLQRASLKGDIEYVKRLYGLSR